MVLLTGKLTGAVPSFVAPVSVNATETIEPIRRRLLEFLLDPGRGSGVEMDRTRDAVNLPFAHRAQFSSTPGHETGGAFSRVMQLDETRQLTQLRAAYQAYTTKSGLGQ